MGGGRRTPLAGSGRGAIAGCHRRVECAKGGGCHHRVLWPLLGAIVGCH